jgi:hypothetical protein
VPTVPGHRADTADWKAHALITAVQAEESRSIPASRSAGKRTPVVGIWRLPVRDDYASRVPRAGFLYDARTMRIRPTTRSLAERS